MPFRSTLAILTHLANLVLYYFNCCLFLSLIMTPPLIGGGIKRCFCLTSVAYIEPKSRTERPRKTKIGREVAHVTRDSNTTFKVKRSRSPGRFTQRGLNAYGGCSGQRGNVFGVGKYCYVASAWRRLGAHGGGEGRGILCRHAHSWLLFNVASCCGFFAANKMCGRPPRYAHPLQVDLLTLKVVSESRVTWATSVPILVFLGLSILDLGPMYTTDGRQTRIIV